MSLLKKALLSSGSGIYNLGNVDPKFGTTYFYDVSSIGTYTPLGFTIKSDGTKLWTVTGEDLVVEYDLSTAWDLSTLSESGSTYDFSARQTNATSIFWHPDGTDFYIAGSAPDSATQYSVSTDFDISSTVTFEDTHSEANETVVRFIFFKSDGSVMYVGGQGTDHVYQYNLTTDWGPIGLQTYDGAKSFAAQDTAPQGIFFKSDGSQIYFVGDANDSVYQQALSTVWDVTTGTGSFTSYVVDSETPDLTLSPKDMFIKPDGSTLFVLAGDFIVQYDLPTAWTISSTEYNLPTTGYLGSIGGVDGIYLSRDGSNLYVTAGSTIDQYPLSTAFDISTAGTPTNSGALNQGSGYKDFILSPNGDKLIIVDGSGKRIEEYDLTTPYDITSHSYVTDLDISGILGVDCRGITVSQDGLELYITDYDNGGAIYQYSMTSAFDLSTAGASPSASYTAPNPANQFTGIDISPSGTTFILTGEPAADGGVIYQYTMSTPFDLSTASYDSVFYNARNDASAITSIRFNVLGSGLTIADLTGRHILQYNLLP